MFHGTSLAMLDSINSDRGKGQVGLSIVSSNRLPSMWKRYLEEKIDGDSLKEELEKDKEEWE